MVTLTLFSAFFFIVFCPITLTLGFYFDKKAKKLFFYVNLYNYIKIISGYVTLEGKFFAMHFKRNKAIIVDLTDLLNTGKKYKTIKDFEIYHINSILESSYSNQTFPIFLEQIYFIMSNVLGETYCMYKPFAICKNDIVLSDSGDNLRFFGKIKIAFNIYVLIVLLVKKITEKFVYDKK